MLDIVPGGEGRRLLFNISVQHNEGMHYQCPDCEACYLYTHLLTCIIAAQYSPEFHAYKSYVGGGTCRIVSGHGGVVSYFESLVCSKRHCATSSVDGERLEHFLGAHFSNTRAGHDPKKIVRNE